MVTPTLRPDNSITAWRRLARGMCAKLRLPVDDVLAHIIGNGTEATSEAAVLTWLSQSKLDPMNTSLQNACDALQRDLSDRLDA